MRGRIDRIDETSTGDVVVYDYKLGTGPSPRDMDEGRDVQIAVYLAAVEALFLAPGQRLAGGGYYAVRRGEARNAHGMYREEFGAAVGAVGAARLDDEAFAEARRRGEGHVWRAYDRLRSGHFEVVPAEGESTCSRCEFRSVCRFDHTRIRHKLGPEGGTK
jgi:RecB family exonuclease